MTVRLSDYDGGGSPDMSGRGLQDCQARGGGGSPSCPLSGRAQNKSSHLAVITCNYTSSAPPSSQPKVIDLNIHSDSACMRGYLSYLVI